MVPVITAVKEPEIVEEIVERAPIPESMFIGETRDSIKGTV